MLDVGFIRRCRAGTFNHENRRDTQQGEQDTIKYLPGIAIHLT
jgi:hypothetical protein